MNKAVIGSVFVAGAILFIVGAALKFGFAIAALVGLGAILLILIGMMMMSDF